jgi:hypothetical protein
MAHLHLPFVIVIIVIIAPPDIKRLMLLPLPLLGAALEIFPPENKKNLLGSTYAKK